VTVRYEKGAKMNEDCVTKSKSGGEVVDAGRIDVRSTCRRWVEVVASAEGQRARHSCECAGVGCPFDPRTVSGAR
jgi:hypothetical protein